MKDQQSSGDSPDLLTRLQADIDGTFSYALVSEFSAKARESDRSLSEPLARDRGTAFSTAAHIVESVTEQMRRLRKL